MANFKIAAAQIPSVRGAIEENIATHTAAIAAAARNGVTVLVFPELSLTGYEPDLAAELAMTAADSRLAPLVALAPGASRSITLAPPMVPTSNRVTGLLSWYTFRPLGERQAVIVVAPS